MKKIIPAIILFASMAIYAQTNLPFQNTKLTIDERVNDLVGRMTLQEKISQMGYEAPSIDRLGIPKYNWWNECLHGVARNGFATVFVQAIGLAAMWDRDMMLKVATAISDEARAKYNDAVKKETRDIYQGLTFWSPNINIFRDPRWGRGMETYGEDPYLTGQMAVQFIKGIQGNDPKYFKAIATAKHFAVHSGPEPERHVFNAEISEYDLRETYLPAFKVSVQDGNVQSLMCAYNSIRGKACCSNDPLLEKILREEWGFKGYVVSDCWAISDIYQYHKEAKDAAEASALSVKAGTDLECGVSYAKLMDAVQRGLVKEDEITTSIKRLMKARFQLGMFDPPEMVPFSNYKMDLVNSAKNKQTALESAKKSIVLLKNDKNLLPLSKKVKTIAVIGPNANDEEVLLGNYNGTPQNPITPLKGIVEKAGKNTKVIFENGCDVADNIPYLDVIAPEFLFTSPDKKQSGLNAELFNNIDWKNEPVKKWIDKNIDLKWINELNGKNFEGNISIRWSGYLIPSKSGEYKLGGFGFNGFNLYLEDSLLVKFKNVNHPAKVYKTVNLIAGKPYKIKIDFFTYTSYAQMQLVWSVPDNRHEERAIEAAKKSDVVVLFMGLSPRLEGEEMKVPAKGFAGGDRLTLDLPEVQEKLIKKIHELDKPVVLVLLNGSALSINWENENIPAIVEAWYGGETAGKAIADVLFGDYNPAGRLPVTFYKSVDQLPDFNDYNMKSGNTSYVYGNSVITYKSKSNGRTYRYFEGEVLYPFGYGLSYTTFKYGNLRLSKDKICAGDPVKLYVDVKNTGKKEGEEVVQLYVKGNIFSKGAIETLKGFERINLKPNQTKTVEFSLSAQTLQEFIDGQGFVIEKGDHTLMIGSSSKDPNMKEIKLVVE
jgi:beta-glucosidase